MHQLRDYLSVTSSTERFLIIADEEFGLLSQDCSALVSEQRALLQVPAHTFLSYTSALTPQLSVASIDYMNTATTLDANLGTIVCIDIGDAPPLKELVKDRRKLGRDFLENYQMCSHVVYVAQAENYSLAELESFREAMTEIAPEISIVWVLNKIGNSTRQKAIQKSFSARISGNQGFYLPREHAVLDRAQGQYSTLVEVAPRSALRRAVKELSIYLDNLI